jgi:hypothetical protein
MLAKRFALMDMPSTAAVPQANLQAATERVGELECTQGAAEAELFALRPLQAQHQKLQTAHGNLQRQVGLLCSLAAMPGGEACL